MGLSLNTVGPPKHGLFVIGSGSKVEPRTPIGLPRNKDQKEDDKEEREEIKKANRRFVPFNPYAEALNATNRLDSSRKVVGPLPSSPPLSTLGSQIDTSA